MARTPVHSCMDRASIQAMCQLPLLADVIPPTEWVVQWIVLPIVGLFLLVGALIYALIRRRRRKRREQA